jgi:hypothetical protein
MDSPLGKRILAGASIAARGAFAWALVNFISQGRRFGAGLVQIPFAAAYAVLVTSWFVLPIGGVLGAAMPRVVRDCSGRAAFFRGAVLGVSVAVLAAILTTLFIEWPMLSGSATIVDHEAWERNVRDQFVGYLATMIPICALWVGVWAKRWRNQKVPCSNQEI